MSDSILEISELSKKFIPDWKTTYVHALKGVSFSLNKGDIFGYIGHNGAGKTTTIKCIAGLIKKSGGSIKLHGKELLYSSQRSKLGYLPELPYFYDHLSVEETIHFFSGLQGIKDRSKIRDTLERVGLKGRESSKVRSLSKGLQQRLAFAQAIVNDPELLILDEPFSGLDPIGRKEMRDIILDLNSSGTTVMISSHVLSDVEYMSNRVGIMVQGELKSVFEVDEMGALFGERYILKLEDVSSELLKGLGESYSEIMVHGKRQVTFRYPSYDEALKGLEEARKLNLKIINFSSSSISLEELFINLTNKERK